MGPSSRWPQLRPPSPNCFSDFPAPLILTSRFKARRWGVVFALFNTRSSTAKICFSSVRVYTFINILYEFTCSSQAIVNYWGFDLSAGRSCFRQTFMIFPWCGAWVSSGEISIKVLKLEFFGSLHWLYFPPSREE